MKGLKSMMVVAALGFACAASGTERKPLPPFALTAADGARVESGALAADATWLFVYVQAQCGPCEALLARLDGDERASAPRIVIVGAGLQADALAAWAARYPNLKRARWLADPERAAASSLGVKALPTAFGLRGPSIEWRLAGTIRDPKELDAILFTWLEQR